MYELEKTASMYGLTADEFDYLLQEGFEKVAKGELLPAVYSRGGVPAQYSRGGGGAPAIYNRASGGAPAQYSRGARAAAPYSAPRPQVLGNGRPYQASGSVIEDAVWRDPGKQKEIAARVAEVKQAPALPAPAAPLGHFARNKGRYLAAGAATAALGTGAYLLNKRRKSKTEENIEKTASLYGLTADEFDYLLQVGYEG